MYQIKVVVEGKGRGLLMHKFSVAATAGIENKVKRTARERETPDIEAEQVAYRLAAVEDEKIGQLCLPAEHFLGSITSAGSNLQVQGKGKKTYKAAFQGNLEIYPDYIGLTDASGQALFNYAIDSRPVRIQATKGRIIRHRPHISAGWQASFTIEVMDDNIPIDVVQAAIEDAGHSKCVGDYRPRYGQYRIVKCEKVV